jgi:hypothetical protein
MDPKKLQRDATRIKSSLTELPNGSVFTSKGCKIYAPVWYAEKGLASIDADKYLLGIFAIVVDDAFYAVQIVTAMVQLTPSVINKVKIDGEEYFEFVFPAESTVYKNLDLVKVDTITYLIFDNFFQRGRIPWYISETDLECIFDTAEKHAGTSVGKQREVTQLITSVISRNPNDPTQSYRATIAGTNQENEILPMFVPLMSIRYSASNTMTKLGGSYFGKGIVSAMVSPSQRPERIETILRNK